MIRLGSALLHADHSQLGAELRRTEAAGVDFFHLDVFDGYFVPEQALSARTIKALRPLTHLAFEIHLAVRDPFRFLTPLADAGSDLIFLTAESTPLLYETIRAVREKTMKVGLCLALGTSLNVLPSALPLIDAILLLRRLNGESKRGPEFDPLVIKRVREVRRMIDAGNHKIDLQVVAESDTAHCVEVCQAGAASLPLGRALHREANQAAYLSFVRQEIAARLAPNAGVASAPPSNRTAGLTSPPAYAAPSQTAQGLAENSPAFGGSAAAQLALADDPRLPATPPTTLLGSTSGRPNVSPHWNVLVAARSFGKNCPETLERMKGAGCVFLPHRFETIPTEDELSAALAEADVLISGLEPVTSRVLAAAPRLKIIAKHGVGYDNIDVAAARARGIPVALAGPAVVHSVADLTLGLLLALARRIPQANASVKAGRWEKSPGVELRAKTLGLVGLGQIGQAVCRRATTFGLKILACDTAPDTTFAAAWKVQIVALPELLGRSDFVSLHAPLSPETKHLIGEPQLALMKPNGFLINTARGELVDEKALFDALQARRIAGAASDVFSQEPPVDSPLLGLENFLGTPHCGGQTAEALRRIGEVTGENILRMRRGERPLYQAA